MAVKRKPTRRDLLVVVGRLQDLFGAITAVSADRNNNRAGQIEAIARHGLNLAIEARSYDPIVEGGPWADDVGEDRKWEKAS